MALEIRFASERQSFGARKRTIALDFFEKRADQGRSELLVGPTTTDPIARLFGQCLGPLENRRKGTLAVGHQPAFGALTIPLLRTQLPSVASSELLTGLERQ